MDIAKVSGLKLSSGAASYHAIAVLESCEFSAKGCGTITNKRGEPVAASVKLAIPDPSGNGDAIYASFILEGVTEAAMRRAFPMALTGLCTGTLLSRERPGKGEYEGRTFTEYLFVPSARFVKDAASLAAANHARSFAGVEEAPKASAERE